MLDDEDVYDAIDPITALEFVILRARPLLLAGEGPYLKIFDHETSQILEVKRVFESQAIHGIIATDRNGRYDDTLAVKLLIWGGRCLRTGELRYVSDEQSNVKINFNEECYAEDWILAACYSLDVGSAVNGFPEKKKTILVTAHNVALTLRCDEGGFPIAKRVTAGPNLMLYSACVERTTDGKIFVASGTVFGEILLWSFSQRVLLTDLEQPVVSHLHFRFAGHEGSVFGIRISPELLRERFGERKRMLASCSDDRTIRIWDVSDFERNDVLLDDTSEIKIHAGPSNSGKKMLSENRCVATAMGHSSRIWDVRFLVSKSSINVFTLGEDSTAQVWQLDENLAFSAPSCDKLDSLRLIHRQTYSYHSGKNIWASAIIQRQDDCHTVCTGGADGRIVMYDIRSNEPTSAEILYNSWTMKDVACQLEEGKIPAANSTNKSMSDPQNTLSKRICEGFESMWVIERSIRSALPTYPSGIFNGEATFQRRSPTTPDYDDEYSYTEQGTFTADQGLSFAAKRQYVYRYQRASDTISAWFVKPDDNSTVDYLFHEVRLDDMSALSNGHDYQGRLEVKANGYHLCVDDHYTPEYTFRFKNGVLQDWTLAYQVKGPQKDYIAEASYHKKGKDHDQNTTHNSDQPALSMIQAQKNRVRRPNYSDLGHDDFKSYVFRTHDSFLVTTAQGRALLGSFNALHRRTAGLEQSIKWEMVGQCDELVSSSITTRTKGSELVLFSGNNGTIFIYDHLAKEVQPVTELGRKVAFLYAQKTAMEDLSIFATCLGRPVGYVLKFPNKALAGGHEKWFDCRPYLLSLPASFIVTGALYIESYDMWILGSRGGALAFYDASLLASETESRPTKVVHNVHGEDAITVIECLPGTRGDYILTAGRDGHYAVHKISCWRSDVEKPEVEFQTVHRTTTPFGPNIEGAFFHPPGLLDPPNHELILWGFRSKNFVVWNATHDMETMDVECGGAHRNWTYLPQRRANDGGTFVWTKASVCRVHTARPSHLILQAGGHGREIKAMATSVMEAEGCAGQYIATGSEDTAIRIWSHSYAYGSNRSNSRFKCLGTFTKHTTGIQQLRWSDDGRFLFSAAGCEELFAWRVQPVPIIDVGAVCIAVCPKVTEDGDLRIMDFCIEEIDQSNGQMNYIISAVYSDSSLRIIQFNSSLPDPKFTVLETSSYTTNCLTQIFNLHPALPCGTPAQKHLCTASSDGHIAFWPSSSSDPNTPQNPIPETNTLNPSHRHPIHQSSIKCMTSIQLPSQSQSSSSSQYLIITGGDDGALGITRLVFPPASTTITTDNHRSEPPNPSPNPQPSLSTLLIPKAHASAINGISSIPTTTTTTPQHSLTPIPPHTDIDGNTDTQSHHLIATSSNDQQVKLWAVTCDAGIQGTGGITLQLKTSKRTSVADVSAVCSMMSGVGSRGEVLVFVAGIGMECLVVD
ncbi:MAG: hypothetical protein Q9216_006043 [Gyalolechia sp. 2 TL-2023]